MSTHYMFTEKPRITFDALKKKLRSKGAFLRYGIEYSVSRDNTKNSFCVANGEKYLWIYKESNGWWSVSRYGSNWFPDELLDSLARLADSTIVSEHDDEYWETLEMQEKEEEEEERRKKSGNYKLVKPHKRRR